MTFRPKTRTSLKSSIFYTESYLGSVLQFLHLNTSTLLCLPRSKLKKNSRDAYNPQQLETEVPYHECRVYKDQLNWGKRNGNLCVIRRVYFLLLLSTGLPCYRAVPSAFSRRVLSRRQCAQIMLAPPPPPRHTPRVTLSTDWKITLPLPSHLSDLVTFSP